MPRRIHNLICGLVAILMVEHGAFSLSAPNPATKPVGNFSSNDLDGWEAEHFVGETHYRLVTEQSGDSVLCAESKKAASGLVRELRVDLDRTPFLNWSWRIENAFVEHDEKTKRGDDYPARVYVVIDDGPFFWQTKALNYVWAGRASPGSLWTSPYISGNVMLIAVESGNVKKGSWQYEKRNVMQDLKLAFGRPITRINAVAVMTDTDDTGVQTKACYGDIFFTAD